MRNASSSFSAQRMCDSSVPREVITSDGKVDGPRNPAARSSEDSTGRIKAPFRDIKRGTEALGNDITRTPSSGR